MGQGYYTVIGVGTTQPFAYPKTMTEEAQAKVLEDLFPLDSPFVFGGEEKRWCVAPVAVSDGYLAKDWRLPMIGGKDGVWRYAEVSSLCATARAQWAALQAQAATLGVIIPDGELLIAEGFD